MKYKVVITDDNPLICRALEKTINWEQRNCQVVGTAGDGEEARGLIDIYRPEIIITDIKMPGMDGLELITEVRKKIPDVQVIMITGYQEFEYAKRAISLGVLELVLKPIDNQKLEEIIDKAIGKLKRARNWEEYHNKLREENQQYKTQEQTSRSVLQGKLVRDLIIQRKGPEDIGEELTELGLEGWNYGVVVGRARTSGGGLAARINGLAAKKLCDLEKGETCIELMIRQDLVFIIGAKRQSSSRSFRIHMKNLLMLVQDHIKERLGEEGRICFAVSQLTTDIRKVREAYEQAESALRASYFSAKGDLLFSGGSPESVETGVHSLVKDLDSFYQILETMPQRALDQEIETIVLRISESSHGDEFKIKCLLSEICITLFRHYENRFSETMAQQGVDRILGEISGLVDIEQGKIYLKKVIARIQAELRENQKMKNPLAVQALEYMRTHYQENLSLSQLAEQLSANPSYLSRLLKKETGNNFVDILANIRIGAAKQLLDSGCRISEACGKVGYSDYTYFYQVFKRLEGISPSEYKKKGKKI